MTVCNMAIEAGARAGLVGVDDTTIDYVQGPPVRADGRRVGSRRVALLAHAAARTPARTSTAWSSSTPRSSCRRSPGARRPRWCCRSKTACPIPTSEKDADQARRDRARADLHGPGAEQADRRHPHRQGLHRLVHQQPHRGPARGRGGGAPPRRPRRGERQAGDGGAGLGPGEGAGRARRAATRCSRRPASSGASRAARCAWR